METVNSGEDNYLKVKPKDEKENSKNKTENNQKATKTQTTEQVLRHLLINGTEGAKTRD